MGYTVEVAYRDGDVAIVDEKFATMHDATVFAVKLADDLGRTMTPYSRGLGTARSVILRQDRAIAIEIRVFLGGLSPDPPPEGLLKLPGEAD